MFDCHKPVVLGNRMDYIGKCVKSRESYEDDRDRPRDPSYAKRCTDKGQPHSERRPDKQEDITRGNSEDLSEQCGRHPESRVIDKSGIPLRLSQDRDDPRIVLCAVIVDHGPLVIYEVVEDRSSENVIDH